MICASGRCGGMTSASFGGCGVMWAGTKIFVKETLVNFGKEDLSHQPIRDQHGAESDTSTPEFSFFPSI